MFLRQPACALTFGKNPEVVEIFRLPGERALLIFDGCAAIFHQQISGLLQDVVGQHLAKMSCSPGDQKLAQGRILLLPLLVAGPHCQSRQLQLQDQTTADKRIRQGPFLVGGNHDQRLAGSGAVLNGLRPADRSEAAGPECLQKSIGDIGFAFVDFIDQDDNAMLCQPAVRDGWCFDAGLSGGRVPVEGPPQWSRFDKFLQLDLFAQALGIFGDGGSDLRFSQSLNSIESPKQIGGAGGGVDGE